MYVVDGVSTTFDLLAKYLDVAPIETKIMYADDNGELITATKTGDNKWDTIRCMDGKFINVGPDRGNIDMAMLLETRGYEKFGLNSYGIYIGDITDNSAGGWPVLEVDKDNMLTINSIKIAIADIMMDDFDLDHTDIRDMNLVVYCADYVPIAYARAVEQLSDELKFKFTIKSM